MKSFNSFINEVRWYSHGKFTKEDALVNQSPEPFKVGDKVRLKDGCIALYWSTRELSKKGEWFENMNINNNPKTVSEVYDVEDGQVLRFLFYGYCYKAEQFEKIEE